MFGFSMLLKSVRVFPFSNGLVTSAACVTCILRALKVLPANIYMPIQCTLFTQKVSVRNNFPAAWYNLLTFSVALSKQREGEREKKVLQ